jgi:hypothetical protein
MDDKFDLWGSVKALSNELRTRGETDWSQKLNGAMAISGLPGEVIGETRHQLEILKVDGAAKRVGLEEQLDTILRHFESLPGQWGSWGKPRS